MASARHGLSQNTLLQRGNSHIWRQCQLLASLTLPEVHHPWIVPGWGHSTSPCTHTPPSLQLKMGWQLTCLLLTSSSCTLRGISNMHICTGCTRAFCTLNKGFASIFPGMEGLLILLCLLCHSSSRSRSSPGSKTDLRSLPARFCQHILPTAAASAALRGLISFLANQRAVRSCTKRLCVRVCEQVRLCVRVCSKRCSQGW